MMGELKPCDNNLCDRQTSSGAAFCCHPCGLAHEGSYEIHESGILGHTDGCNQRHAERSNPLSSANDHWTGDPETDRAALVARARQALDR